MFMPTNSSGQRGPERREPELRDHDQGDVISHHLSIRRDRWAVWPGQLLRAAAQDRLVVSGGARPFDYQRPAGDTSIATISIAVRFLVSDVSRR